MEQESFGEKFVREVTGRDGKIDIEKLKLQTLKYKHPFWYKVALIRKYWALWLLIVLFLLWLLNL